MTTSDPPRMSHSESNLFLGRSLKDPIRYKEAIATAIKNMAQLMPASESVERGIRIAELSRQEESIRLAHIYMARAALALHKNDTVSPLDAGDDLLEASLIDFDALVAQMHVKIPGMHWREVGKGISSELAHVEQLGDWDASRDLDDAVRQLPESEILTDTGIFFERIHDSNDTDTIYNVHRREFGSVKGLVVVRKRPIANVIGSTGLQYDVIRKSSFDIDRKRLPQAIEHLIATAAPDERDRDKQSEKEAAGQIGTKVVEQLVQNPDERHVAPLAVPLTSVYMVLLRHKDIPYDTSERSSD